jgi:hypothetical protein
MFHIIDLSLVIIPSVMAVEYSILLSLAGGSVAATWFEQSCQLFVTGALPNKPIK